MSVDRASRFVVAWDSGRREETLAETVVATTRQRAAGHVGIPYVPDGWKPYEDTIRTWYRDREPSGIRPGWDIQRTPAMAIGLSDHIWSWTELLTLRGKAH